MCFQEWREGCSVSHICIEIIIAQSNHFNTDQSKWDESRTSVSLKAMRHYMEKDKFSQSRPMEKDKVSQSRPEGSKELY